MKEYLDLIRQWKKQNKSGAIARVVRTWGSSPRPAGSLMLVSSDGSIAGSVSGGCVEGSVVKSSEEVITNNKGKRLAYGVSDEEAWSVGLSCGGRIQVYLQALDLNEGSVWSELIKETEADRTSIMVSSLEDGDCRDTLIKQDKTILGAEIDEELLKEAELAFKEGSHRTVEREGREYFIQVFSRKHLLLVIGAAHITADLVDLGSQFGFETVVIDPRGYFADNVVFKTPPSQIIKSYPSEVLKNYELDSFTFCAILSHDPKIDDDALQVLQHENVAYIGALGSRKTHAKRKARLLEKGVAEEFIDTIHAPIGVGINALSAKEIALSVMAQIIQVKNQHVKR